MIEFLELEMNGKRYNLGQMNEIVSFQIELYI